jgi:hypothetical protein
MLKTSGSEAFGSASSRRGTPCNQRILRLEDAWRFALQPEIFNLWGLLQEV